MKKTPLDQILYFLKSRGPATAGDIGNFLDISKPGAQQNLAKAAREGLIYFEDRAEGRGRPRRYWHLTEKGHARFPDRHSDLSVDLLKSAEKLFGAEGLEKLIRDREAETLAKYREKLESEADIAGKIARLAALRNAEGYMASWREIGGGEYLFIENHCPICAAAAFCQGLCRSELEIFRKAFGAHATVERTDHILSGARRCAYRICKTPQAE
ncbi:MarR family transcriptional regulator [Sneathiella chungangensis]|uniref:MarR family transcriptional regulator n=1 Tax=Sneathiella chungangensis TaxID=1418234 RepID=A0A845MJC1_9PROT|nr:metalloregulator ArsR/SmtB family transcription factor [Sneathiella chungangensis]MZR24028.1 MarR family transcriptional regulator [Sneathiella chungangensis]